MKHLFKYLSYFFIAFSLVLFVQCDEDDSEIEWGVVKVYMPQASILDGGLSNYYPVPLQNNPLTQNYVLDTVAQTLDITLGVYRSGLQRLEAYSVDVETDQDTIGYLIDNEILTNAVLLPSDTYTLPEKISVVEGQRETTFSLKVNVQKLIDEYIMLSGKKLVLAVKIANPTNYDLNQSLSTTIVVIDSKSFMPAPPIINWLEGGNMEADDQQFWQWTTDNQVWGYSEDGPSAGEYGCLAWFDENTADANESIFQLVELEIGQKYELSVNVKFPAGGFNYWFVTRITDKEPGSPGWDQGNTFYGFGAWSGAITTQDGDLRVVGNASDSPYPYGNGLVGGTNGVFTAVSSPVYIVINAGVCCGGTFNGPLLIDDVILTKVE
ncbi:MAG: DUF1735 domain-containing protein [Draconibacterium sp.]